MGSDKHLLDRVVSCANLLTAAVLECNIAHRRYIAVFCMLFKLGVTRRTLSICCFVSAVCDRAGYTRYFGGLVAHRYIYRLLDAEPRRMFSITKSRLMFRKHKSTVQALLNHMQFM